MKRLSVLVCTHNRADILRGTLDHLLGCDMPEQCNVELVVVANACDDDTHTILDQYQAQSKTFPLRWIFEPTPGKSFALNRGIAETVGDAICFLDDDHHVENGFLKSICEALKIHPVFDILCGFLMPAWDGREPQWVHETGRYRIPIRPLPEQNFGPEPHEITIDGKQPGGGNITVRRRLLARMDQAFDTEIGPRKHTLNGGEDHDFIKRARQAGARIFYDPAIRHWHILEHERFQFGYMIKKAYQRSHASFNVNSTHGPRAYMLRQTLSYFLNALTSLNPNRRFYYWIRLAASLGEFSAAIKYWRSSLSAPSHE